MKMKMKLTNGLLGLGALLIASQVNAATLQVNPASTNTAIGNTFELTIQGTGFTEATTGGGFSLMWDASILTLNTTVFELTGDQLTCFVCGQFGAAGFNLSNAFSNPGQLDAIVGTGFGAPVSGGFTLATLSFTAINPGTTVADLNFFANVQEVWNGTDIDLNTFEPIPLIDQPNYIGATVKVNAVPVPAAVWLFGSGLIGMVGIARRRKTRLA